MNKIKLFVDGAAKNNPGPAGAGIYIKKNDTVIFSYGFYLGEKTNNQAEYLALILGLFCAKKYLNNESCLLEIISDSELLVKQIKGIYKIKNENLKILYNAIKKILKNIDYTINHIIREHNQNADKNANIAIKNKIKITNEILKLLNEYNISI